MTFHPIGTLAAQVAARSSLHMRHDTMTAQDIEPAAAFLAVDADALRETVEMFPGRIDTRSLNGAEESLMAALAAVRSAKGVRDER